MSLETRGYCLTDYGKAMVEKHIAIANFVISSKGRKWIVLFGLYDDLLQAARHGLIDAVAHFNPNKDCTFRSYAERRIWGECQDFLRGQHAMTPHRDGRKVKSDDRPKIHSMYPTFSPGTDAFITAHVNGGPEHFGFPPSPLPPVGSEFESAERFEAWLHGFSEDEKFLIREYYAEIPKSMKQIGYLIGKSESRVSQMHDMILDRLRDRATFPKYRELATA